MKIGLLALVLCLGFGATVQAQLRPQLRPDPVATLRPQLRPDPEPTPMVAKAAAPLHVALSRQEARADALTIVPPAPPMVLVGLWTAPGPMFRPEGDFGAAADAIDGLTLAVLRPELRPGLNPGLNPGLPAMVTAPPVVLASAAAILRPPLRPGDLLANVVTDAPPTFDAALSVPAAPTLSAMAIPVALIPQTRSADIVAKAEAARVERVRGSVCGNPQIQGEALGPVSGSGACGIDDGVLVRSVNGVRLSTAATIDCNTANALQDWVARVALPTVGNTGGGLASLQIMGTYACRNRNNATSGRLSEHGFGRAVDIGGFGLQNGKAFTVLNGWGTDSYGAMLRQMHRAACGIFGTVLGPESNAYHRDHFHFDTASYRSGSYCE